MCSHDTHSRGTGVVLYFFSAIKKIVGVDERLILDLTDRK